MCVNAKSENGSKQRISISHSTKSLFLRNNVSRAKFPKVFVERRAITAEPVRSSPLNWIPAVPERNRWGYRVRRSRSIDSTLPRFRGGTRVWRRGTGVSSDAGLERPSHLATLSFWLQVLRGRSILSVREQNPMRVRLRGEARVRQYVSTNTGHAGVHQKATAPSADTAWPEHASGSQSAATSSGTWPVGGST